jgi:hypothetical protein
MKAVLAALAFALGLLVAPHAAAQADPGGCPPGTSPQPAPGGGVICIPAADPGDPGGTTPGNPNPGSGGDQPTCTFNGQKIPCVTELGVWFSSRSCYAQPMDPQPPEEDERWEGRSPEEGAVWRCMRPGIELIWLFFFVPRGETPGLVDPGELGRETLDTMALVVPTIRTAPSVGGPTFVNLETWLWIPESQFQTLSKTVTAGGTTVTVVAEPTHVWWETGDGEDQTCDGAGRPWTADLGDAATTDCSHSYAIASGEETDGLYRLRAAIYYQATWACEGACLRPAGDLGVVTGSTSSVGIEVRERQSLVTGGS